MKNIIAIISSMALLCLSGPLFAQFQLPAERMSPTLSSLDPTTQMDWVTDGSTSKGYVMKTLANRPGWWMVEFNQPYLVHRIDINKPEESMDLLLVGSEAPFSTLDPDLLMDSPWFDYYHMEAESSREVSIPIKRVYERVLIYSLKGQLSLSEVTFWVDDNFSTVETGGEDICDQIDVGVGYLDEYFNQDGEVCVLYGNGDEISIDGGLTWITLSGGAGRYCFKLDRGVTATVIVRTKEGCSMKLVVNIPVEPPTMACQSNDLTPLGEKVLEAVKAPDIKSQSTVDEEFRLTCNNKLNKVLVDGPAIFEEASILIAGAEEEVLMAFYVWDQFCEATGDIGAGFQQNQINRAGQTEPLLVRIMVDFHTLGSNPLPDIWQEIESWGLDMSMFNFQLATFNHWALGNLHDKYIVVDENHVLITGANPQPKHDLGYQDIPGNSFCMLFPPLPGQDLIGPWRDSGYSLSGSVASAVKSAFNFTWNVDASHHFVCQKIAFNWYYCFTNLLFRHPDPVQNFEPKHLSVDYGDLHIIEASRKRRTSITNNSTENPQDQAWLTMINSAQTEINIATPNINDDAFREAIVNAAGRGVTVNLLTGRLFNANSTNSLGQGGYNKEVVQDLRKEMRENFPNQFDNLVIRWYSRDKAKQVLNNGGRAMHAKYMSVDGQVAMIGSGNHDTQSWNFSQELNLVFDGEDATSMVDGGFFTPSWDISNESYIELYEGPNGTQDISCLESTIFNHHWNYVFIDDCHSKYGNNDEAKSAIIYNTPAMKKITLYDESNPGTSPTDDFLEIITLQDIDRLLIPDFETSFSNDQVQVIYHPHTNLNGKVSSIKIEDYVPDPKVILYENTYGNGDIVCVIKVNQSGRYINFTQGHPENCDNDEVKSIVLQEIPAGRIIRLYDDSSGTPNNDDWVEIKVHTYIPYLLIPSLEISFSNPNITMTYHEDDNLNGKVSSLRYNW